MKEALTFTLCCSDSLTGQKSEHIPATVPGCVQTDWGRAKGLPSIHEGDHQADYYGLEDKFWHYETTLTVREGEEVPFLCLDGVEYEYDVVLDGETVAHHEGMFSREALDLSEYKGRTVPLEIVIYPAPKLPGVAPESGLGFESAESCIPPFQYGWDWSPRYIVLGLVDEVYVEYRPLSRVAYWEPSYRLSEDGSYADITVDYETTADGELRLTLLAPDGSAAKQERYEFVMEGADSLSMRVESPALWYPHNHGAQPVYTLKMELLTDGKVTDEKSCRISFRRSRLVLSPGVQTDGNNVEPATTFTLNGETVFAQGSNWVPCELCRADVTRERVRELLQLAKDANMNLLRLWGGSYIQPDFFYDLCDELGLMVWQEFPLACANYPDKPAYLRVLEQEAEAIVKQLRTHACVVLWCGGNELLCKWSNCMTMQSHALRLLDAVTYRLDPDVPYWHSSPQHGVKHGGYELVGGDSKEILKTFYDTDYLGYTEFGCGCVSEYEVLCAVMTEEELGAPTHTSVWKARHGARWGHFAALRAVTGLPEDADLKTLCEEYNEAQANCYRSLFEAVRHKAPRASLAVNWDYNEPWTTLAGNELVGYPARPRPSYYAVKEALRPTLLSLGFEKLGWRPLSRITLTPYLLNDSPAAIPSLTATVRVCSGETVLQEFSVCFGETGARQNQKGEALSFLAPAKAENRRLTVTVTCEEHPEFDSCYTLYVHPAAGIFGWIPGACSDGQ